MAAFSNFAENAVLNHLLRGTAVASPTDVYVALFTDAAAAGDLEANTITAEVTGGGYARQTVAFTAPANGAVENDGAVSFADMPAVTVAYVAVMDAATAGNVLFYGALNTARTLTAGDTFTIASGDLDISLD